MPRHPSRPVPSARLGSDGGENGSTRGRSKRKRNPEEEVQSYTSESSGVKKILSVEDSIDDIFATLKACKKQKATKPDCSDVSTKKIRRSNRGTCIPGDSDDDDSAWRAGTSRRCHDEPKVHRYTEDGLAVYKYYHLGIQQDDGGTPYCPFDCDCCR